MLFVFKKMSAAGFDWTWKASKRKLGLENYVDPIAAAVRAYLPNLAQNHWEKIRSGRFITENLPGYRCTVYGSVGSMHHTFCIGRQMMDLNGCNSGVMSSIHSFDLYRCCCFTMTNIFHLQIIQMYEKQISKEISLVYTS